SSPRYRSIVRALAGDSTMTRFRAIRSGVPDAAQEVLVDLELFGLFRLGLAMPALARRDLHEPDAGVREHERGIAPIDEDRALPVDGLDVRADQHRVARGGLLEQVDDD